MEYRKLPHGNEHLSTIGLGLGNIHVTADDEIETTINYAMEQGINFFDLCCGRIGVYKDFGRCVSGRRDKIYTQMHFGAVYENDTYGFSRNLDLIKYSFDKALTAANMDYTDFGYIHCIDEDDDFDNIIKNGLWDYVCSLKEQGVIHHIGFSSHTPEMANRFLDTGIIDLFMFSINPAYDYSKGTYGYGSTEKRMALYRRAEKMGIGITVMKPFAGGQLLDEKRSPLNLTLNRNQCIQYALDRPAVLSCLPSVGNVQDVKEILKFYSTPLAEREYSILGQAAPDESTGRCVYCNHCAPCPKGIDIGLVNKYFDLAQVGDSLARSHYEKLTIHADACIQCGHCEKRCPFHVKQMDRMVKIKEFFSV
ncbi:MAG: aldo/keto reductase [Oliverpabstia sp.]